MPQDITLFMAFVAGLLSFLSPCILPLIPSYFSILGGAVTHSKNTTALWPALAFVLGFSAVFIALGIVINTIFFIFSNISLYINIVAGIIVIILGLNVIFDFIGFLNYEKRLLQKFKTASAFIAGTAFAVGWTPCVGPILTGILLMAGQSGKTLTAVFYLALYSAGMALPFILFALFFDFFKKQMARLRSGLLVIRYISGLLLVIIGIMILTGKYSALNGLIQTQIFRYIDWAQEQAVFFRILAQFLAWLQNF